MAAVAVERAARRMGILYVSLATLLFSTTPVLIRWAAPLPPYVITWVRLAVATLTVGVLAIRSGQGVHLGLKDLPRFALFGGITAVHFLCYIASLSYTTIAHSLTLTYTAPIFVTLFSAWFLRERIPRWKYVGVLVAVLGVGILAGFEPRFDRNMLIGDALALGSAVAFGFYSIAGRSQRERYPLFTYALATYGMGALWLTPVSAPLAGSGWGWQQAVAVLALGIFPLGFGHTLYNAALRKVHATYVNLVATQEVTGGILLGWLLLGEAPTLNAGMGAIVTLLGVAMVLI
jgi:drug/metabolite transporter (DMT)-like permease